MMSSSLLRHQVWLTTHVRNPEDLIGLIFLFQRSNWLGLFIPSDIVEEGKLLTLVPDEACLSPNRVIPDGLYVCPSRPKGLEFEKDM